MTLKQLRRIRWAVRAALVLGIAASVSANVLHAAPNPIARTISAWPPIALLITLELVSRVPVARRLGWVRTAATFVIAGIAAWVSYWHMAAVAARYGETDASPYLLPLSVDGLIVVTSVSLVELAARIRAVQTEPVEALPYPPFPAADEATNEQVTEPADPPNRGNGHDPVKVRRANALAALALGGEPDEIAADVGVTVQTLQRWVDGAAKQARRPPGRRREETTTGTVPAAN